MKLRHRSFYYCCATKVCFRVINTFLFFTILKHLFSVFQSETEHLILVSWREREIFYFIFNSFISTIFVHVSKINYFNFDSCYFDLPLRSGPFALNKTMYVTGAFRYSKKYPLEVVDISNLFAAILGRLIFLFKNIFQ